MDLEIKSCKCLPLLSISINPFVPESTLVGNSSSVKVLSQAAKFQSAGRSTSSSNTLNSPSKFINSCGTDKTLPCLLGDADFPAKDFIS